MLALIIRTNGAGYHFLNEHKKPRLLASIEKARELIGYHPLIDFEEGFQTNIEWFRDHWEKIEAAADFPPGMSSAVRGAESICEITLEN
jgi:hypothetical protein